MPDRYVNVQRGYLRPLLAASGALCLVLIFFSAKEAAPGLFIAALLLYLLSFVFGSLTVEDKGACLLVRFGPLPLLRRSLRYEDIASAEACEASLFRDGLGAFWTPEGFSFNVGGSQRVRVKLKSGRSFFVGTDDPEGLLELIEAKLKPASPSAEEGA